MSQKIFTEEDVFRGIVMAMCRMEKASAGFVLGLEEADAMREYHNNPTFQQKVSLVMHEIKYPKITPDCMARMEEALRAFPDGEVLRKPRKAAK